MQRDASTFVADPVFEEEQDHLSRTYEALQRIGRNAAQRMEKTAAEAALDKRAMADELSVNLATYADAMETYADFAAMNRIVDLSTMAHSLDAEKLAAVTLLLKQPYFAKVELRLPEVGRQRNAEADTRVLYIGATGLSDDDRRRVVVDWRSPIAEVYYDQGTGRTSYEANGRLIEADLLLRRQFDIEEDRLLAYFDTTEAIQDPLLLASLSRHRSAAMSAITATIQQEQNAVIRHDDVPTLMVMGAAGSGKTSVMMQRIAYLFYRQRDTLRPEEVALITPNPLFQSYIANVLPAMGEKNPEAFTYDELLAELLPKGRGAGRTSVTPEQLEAIDRALSDLRFAPTDFIAVEWEGTHLVSAKTMQRLSEKYDHIPAGPHRVTLMREDLLKRLRAKLVEIAKSEALRDELFLMTPDEQTALFGTPLSARSEAEVATLARDYVERRYAGAIALVERDEWVDIDRIGTRLLGRSGLTSLEWAYLKMGVTGFGRSAVKYVMVDEVQDYSAAQLMVLARYYRTAHFLLLGDPEQAIAEGTASFDDIRAVFAGERGASAHAPVAQCLLPTSYRCTPQITELFASLAREGMNISSVQRDGTDPRIEACPDEAAYEQALLDAVERSLAYEGLTALIVPWKSDARKMAAWLEERLPASSRPWTAVVDKDEALPSSGLVILPLELAKGLEFDAVLVPDASERTFPADDLSRRRLYTTVSRATRELTILSPAALTPLLAARP